MAFILKTEPHFPCQNISEQHGAGLVTAVIIIHPSFVYGICKESEKW